MILFLDFDGVLHPEPLSDLTRLFERAPLLEACLAQFPDVKIVITSTWRNERSMEELKAILGPGLASRVVGITPKWIEVPESFDRIGYQRHAEIDGWLRIHAPVWESWVALDDKSWLFKPFLEQLVKVDPTTGLTEESIVKLRCKLLQSR
jgi:hypothetical protein